MNRAASDLRGGTPVLLDGSAPLLILAAETAGPDAIAELASLGKEPPGLLLAPVRAAAVLHRPVEQDSPALAVRLPAALLEPPALRGLADPTLALPGRPGPLEPAALPTLAAAALDLAKIARLLPAVLGASISPETRAAVAERALLVVQAEDLEGYRDLDAAGLRQIADARVPLIDAADARIVAFRSERSAIEHLAIIIGKPAAAEAPLVRIHSECFTGALLGSMRCDCGEQLRGAIARMAQEGAGILLYLAQEGRGIGLVNKLRAYAMQDRGLDTLDANRVLGWGPDERSFMTAATMLESLGFKRVRLLTNNPDKMAALVACGIEVVGREAHAFAPNGVNDEYLDTKAARFGHLLD
jgi:GTP cyclohydrolase II